MLKSSLMTPDGAQWRDEVDHSRQVAKIITDCYDDLARAMSRADAYLRAHERAWAWVNAPMSKRQRMRIFFILGMSLVGGGANAGGAQFLRETFELARSLGDLAACAESAYLLGSALATDAHYSSASDQFKNALDLLEMLTEGAPTDGAKLKGNIFVSLAVAEATMEDWEPARRHLHDGRSLLITQPDAPLQIARIDWAEAVLLQWMGQTGEGLRYALKAADVFVEHSSATMQTAIARVESVVAQIALDLAATSSAAPPHYVRDSYLELARPYAMRAVARSDGEVDPAGEVLTLLARQRYTQLARDNTDRMGPLNIALQRATELKDIMLLAQVHTALGREFASNGEEESSLNAYRNALDCISGSDAPALGIPARRALTAASIGK